jgi:hypothetical protein
VLVLLPPSEGKTPPARGPAFDLDALGAPQLRPMRQKVLDALVETSARPDAVGVLGVGASLGPEVARNTMLPVAPTARAATVYSGVLYASAGLADLTGRARTRALTSVRTVSALWGLVSPADPIPAYRLAMGTDLPGLGPLASAWRDALGAVLDPLAAGRLVVDCRSAAYLAAWRPPHGTDWVAVRVERELDGVRSVVSHHAKHARGVLTRHLLVRDGHPPRDADDLAGAAHELVGGGVAAVELGTRPRSGARVLTLVVR